VSATQDKNSCIHTDEIGAYAISALPADEVAVMEAHLASCAQCRDELDALRPALDSLSSSWPTDVLRPTSALQDRLARRIAAEMGTAPQPPPTRTWSEPTWNEVAPGISCKLLATDPVKQVVSMLVRLTAGTEYPPHTHRGVEELHLLDGELWIDDRKLHPGDYNRAEPGTADKRVWSETGCTCVLITSTQDILR
jgi:anti-sigma factor ChrR (cupin superfamily)